MMPCHEARLIEASFSDCWGILIMPALGYLTEDVRLIDSLLVSGTDDSQVSIAKCS